VIVCYPDPKQTLEVPIDDLDFFLLDIVPTGSHGSPVFDIDLAEPGECLNRPVPHFTRPELIAALAELFEGGDIEAVLNEPSKRRRTFRANDTRSTPALRAPCACPID